MAQLTKAGVRPHIAEAHAAVNTPAHVQAEAQRCELAAKLNAAGLRPAALVAELSARITGRVSIAEGATYTTQAGEVIRGIRAQRMPGSGRRILPRRQDSRNAADLAKLLGAYLVTKRLAMRARPKKRPPGSHRTS